MENSESIVIAPGFGSIQDITDGDSAREAVSALGKLEKMLKAADMFNAKAREYARLETDVYLRIIAEGLVDEIPSQGYRRRVISWLSTLTEEERVKAIDYCDENGLTIRGYWKVKVHEPERQREEIAEMRYEGGLLINEFRKKGEVELKDYFDRCDNSNRIPSDIREGYKDIVRNRIRKLGGHGLGDGSGTYVSSEHAKDYVLDVLENKSKSILKDIDRMRSFLCDVEKPNIVLETKTHFSDELSDESKVNVLFILFGLAEPYMKADKPTYRARIYIDILSRLGISPGELYDGIYQMGNSETVLDVMR